VSIDSEPGEGTTVSLTFPRSDKPLTPAAAVPHALPATAGMRLDRLERLNGSVLLVEDDLTVAELTVQMLESIGFTVLHAKSAAAALDALSAGRRVDIVFSDVMMPGGMNGVDLAREIRKRRPDLPVILTTGYVEAARTAVTEGLEVLVKPYPLEVLARTLNAHLSRQAAAAQ
jgi:CheY-like chemotaxis protein